MSDKITYRDASRGKWQTHWETPVNDEIKLGALLRIADACEKMCARIEAVEVERDELKKQWKYALERIGCLSHSNAALRGVITKLKKARSK